MNLKSFHKSRLQRYLRTLSVYLVFEIFVKFIEYYLDIVLKRTNYKGKLSNLRI